VLGVAVMMIGWSAGVRHGSRRVALSSLVYTTGNGERANITLPDGGTVTLNVASRIEVPQDFGTRDRLVYLQGQADFRVAHQGGVPFTVEAGGTRARVLGTEFGVRAYGTGPVQVAVRTGRVVVGSLVLGARDIAMVTPSQVMVAHDQDLAQALGFTQGRLVLNDVPLRETLPDLERWYDVKIQWRDPSIGAIPVHAVLTNGSIGDLMEALRVTLGLHVVCEGRTLTLDRR
jgi:ferric-dicitrate binding protein FerR (iron transport regulator)